MATGRDPSMTNDWPSSFHKKCYRPPLVRTEGDDDYSAAPPTNKCDHTRQRQRQQSSTLTEDRYWSIFSNSFFVAGGFFSLVGNSWDYVLNKKIGNVEDLNYYLARWHYVTYRCLTILWPTIFLLNSIIDVKWALVVRERSERNKPWKRFVHKILNDPTQGRKRDSLMLNTALVVPQTLIRRTRNHIGHRRQLSAATAFGFSALFSVAAAVLSVIMTDTSTGR